MVVCKFLRNRIDTSSCDGDEVELTEIAASNEKLNWDYKNIQNATQLTTSPRIYEVVLKSIHPVPHANNNKITPLATQHGVRAVDDITYPNVIRTSNEIFKFNRFSALNSLKSSWHEVSENKCNVIKKTDNDNGGSKSIQANRKIEFIPLNTISLVQKENAKYLGQEKQVVESNDYSLLNGQSDKKANREDSIVICNSHLQDDGIDRRRETSSKTTSEKVLIGDVANDFYRERNIDNVINGTVKKAWCDRTTPVQKIESKVMKDNWLDNKNLDDYNKWTNLMRKVKDNFYIIRDALLNRRVREIIEDDDWTVAIPASLSIISKDSDWSSQINDIEDSNISEDIWFHHIQVPHTDSHLCAREWTPLSEVNNNASFEIDPCDPNLQELTDNQKYAFGTTILRNSLRTLDKECPEINERDWLFSINDIRSTNQHDNEWTTMINAILLT